MEKPISVTTREFKENLIRLINESGIHVSIAEPIVRSVYEEVAGLANRVYEAEKAEYEKSLQEPETE